jgi:hypothetical protein
VSRSWDFDPKPFERLDVSRVLGHDGLPTELAKFYVENEGVGLHSSPDRPIRLCQLSEVERIGWRDIHIFGTDDHPGWEQFAAYRIGMSTFFDEIAFVLCAPSCPTGSILTIGPDVAGPGGVGPARLNFSLVLASSFADWLSRLEDCGWEEYGLVPGALSKLPESDQVQHRRYFQSLNPGIEWGITEPSVDGDGKA